MRCWLLCLVLGVAANCALSARILAVLPNPFMSHHILFQSILKTLAKRGHQIVSYSPFPLNKPVANYTDIHLDNMQNVVETGGKELLDYFMNLSPIEVYKAHWDYYPNLLQNAFNNDKIIDLLQSNEKFDLVILEALFCQEVFLGLGHRFNAPVVDIQSFGAFSIVNKVAGNTLSLAYIPDNPLPYSDHMSIYERFYSSYSILYNLFLYYTQYLPKQDNIMRTLFNDPTMPPLEEMVHNISIFVNNAHPQVHYAQPYTSNIIPIGGIHIATEHEPLPPELKKFLDEATHGVIYFSSGSFLPDYLLPQEYFDNFINVFKKLPQRVVWISGSKQPKLPDNVIILKWAPQQDILAHPNVVLFITHGGLFSQHETINAGVPVVCTPYFGDQKLNAKFYEDLEIGVKLPFDNLSEKTIESTLTTVLNNHKYKENMMKLSSIYKNRPMSPADSLVFWVEYVLTHEGAHHLRPVSATLHWYQLTLLDIVTVILVVVVVILLLCFFIIKKLFKVILTKKQRFLASKKDN